MSQITDHLPNLVGGITQQPPETRIRTAVEEMINAYPSAVQGLSKRRGAEHMANLNSASVSATSFMHTIDRSEYEKYFVLINADGTVEVYNALTGELQTVEVDNRCATYLSSSDPSVDIRAITAGDYTFIANRSVTVERDRKPVGAPTANKHQLEFRRFDTLGQSFQAPSVTEGNEAYNVDVRFSFTKTINNQLERFTIDPVEGVRKALTSGSNAMSRYEFGYDWIWVSGVVPQTTNTLTAPFTTDTMTLTAPTSEGTSMVNRFGLDYTDSAGTKRADPFAVYPKIYTSSSYGNAEALIADVPAALGDVEIPFLRTRRNAVQGFFINIGTNSSTGDGAASLISSMSDSDYKVGYDTRLKVFETIDSDDSINVLDPNILTPYAALLGSLGISTTYIDALQSTASDTRAVLLHSENDPQDLGLPSVTYSEILANRLNGYTETVTDTSGQTHTVHLTCSEDKGILTFELRENNASGALIDTDIVAAAELLAGVPYPVPRYDDDTFRHPNTKHEIFFPTNEQDLLSADTRQRYQTKVLLRVDQEINGVMYEHEVLLESVRNYTSSSAVTSEWTSSAQQIATDHNNTVIPQYDSSLTLIPAPSGTDTRPKFSITYDEGRNSLTISSGGSLIKFRIVDVRQESGSGLNNSRLIDYTTTTVADFESLPAKGSAFDVVRVVGARDNPEDDYYVSWNGSNWVEDIGFGEAENLAELTMPQVLARTSTGGWKLSPHTWSGREVGDSVSNKSPSFVAEKVNDMFLYQGRLGVCSGESVIMSEVDALEQFYRSTCVQLEDDNRIDVTLLFGRVEIPHSALPVQEELMLFSDKGQFSMNSGQFALTPKTVSVKQVGDFLTSRKVKPYTLGNTAFFTSEVGDYTLAREFFLGLGADDRLQSSDLTIQCPQYIPSNARYITASRDNKILFVLSRDEATKIYVYKFEYDGTVKIQSAWCEWDLGVGDIESIGVMGSYLYVVSTLNDQREFSRIDIRDQQDLPGTELLRLDLQAIPTATYYANGADGSGVAETLLNIPFDGTDVAEVWNLDGGHTLPVDRYTRSGNLFVRGDYTDLVEDGKIVVGVPYEMDIKLSTFYLRAPRKPQGEILVTDGRLTLNAINVAYTDTASFHVEVTSRGRETKTYHAGPRVGFTTVTYGDVPKSSGVLRVPVQTRNDNAEVHIKNDQPYGCNILHIDWFGKHIPNARRV